MVTWSAEGSRGIILRPVPGGFPAGKESCPSEIPSPGGAAQTGGPRKRENRSERGQRGLFVLLNFEELVELGDLEHFHDFAGDLAHDQLAAGRLHLLIQRDQLAQRGAGEEL